ncbi:MAG: hypothetical protein M1831_001374 [Alyxoria varia]|nr:MAG: hypothetical protein M1831_001374 [Alyxoria varia]
MALPSRLPISTLPMLSLLSMGLASPLLKRDDEADDNAGASGDDGKAYDLSTGGLVAIIVVVVVVAIFGIASAVLFYVAKKRQWKLREKMKHASRRVASKVTTPLTSRFPRDQTGSRGTVRMHSPAPARTKHQQPDPEKRQTKKVTQTMEIEEPAKSNDKRWKTILPETWTVGPRR